MRAELTPGRSPEAKGERTLGGISGNGAPLQCRSGKQVRLRGISASVGRSPRLTLSQGQTVWSSQKEPPDDRGARKVNRRAALQWMGATTALICPALEAPAALPVSDAQRRY